MTILGELRTLSKGKKLQGKAHTREKSVREIKYLTSAKKPLSCCFSSFPIWHRPQSTRRKCSFFLFPRFVSDVLQVLMVLTWKHPKWSSNIIFHKPNILLWKFSPNNCLTCGHVLMIVLTILSVRLSFHPRK